MDRSRRPTMRDVAGVAGVSLSTVSRVVNGGDGVRGDLVARVRQAVELLGYRHDLTASSLRRSDRLSASIGLIVEDVGNPFFSAVERGVEDVARARGVHAFAGSSDGDPARERELAHAFCTRRVDGLIIVPVDEDHSHLLREREAGVALAFVDRPPRFLDADAVLSDNGGGAEAAIAHLVAAGHRRIGFLGDRQRIFTAAERLRGHRAALVRHGLGEDPALVHADLPDSAAARAAAREMLSRPDRPTAVFASQNLVTIGVIHALRDLELQHTVALVGFDDIVLADAVEPATTVIAQDPAALGRRAAELLFSRLDGREGASVREVLPTRLVPRGSGELAPAVHG